MSRIGKKPVSIPSGVTVDIKDSALSVKGPKGTLSMGLSDLVEYKLEGDALSRNARQRYQGGRRSHWGMQRTMVSNLVDGVTEGFTKVLEISGVGYRASAQGRKLKLQLGYSHDVDIDLPDGIEVKTPDNTTVEVSGIDKQLVGQVAAEIRPLAQARTLQGQGHQVPRRVYLPQGREEEVRWQSFPFSIAAAAVSAPR